MIISDLQYIESVNDLDVVGGRRPRRRRRRARAEAFADADALAIGRRTYSSTYTDAQAVAGVFSSSNSSSHAIASY